MNQDNLEKTVYFVRHGESEGNVAPVFQGLDSPLSGKGIEQAKFIAERVSKIPFEILISSTLQRAKETTEIISETTGKTPEFSDLFIERAKPPQINNKGHDDEEAYSIWQEWEKELYTPGEGKTGGESFDNLMTRARKAIHFLEERPEQEILVVTHGYFLRTIIANILIGDLLTGDVFKNFMESTSMKNTGITVARYASSPKRWSTKEEKYWRLWVYNDHSHLG